MSEVSSQCKSYWRLHIFDVFGDTAVIRHRVVLAAKCVGVEVAGFERNHLISLRGAGTKKDPRRAIPLVVLVLWAETKDGGAIYSPVSFRYSTLPGGHASLLFPGKLGQHLGLFSYHSPSKDRTSTERPVECISG